MRMWIRRILVVGRYVMIEKRKKKKGKGKRSLYALCNKLMIMWRNILADIYRIYVIKSIKHVIITYYYSIIASVCFAYPFYTFCRTCLECIVRNCFNDSKICHMNARYTCIRAEYFMNKCMVWCAFGRFQSCSVGIPTEHIFSVNTRPIFSTFVFLLIIS